MVGINNNVAPDAVKKELNNLNHEVAIIDYHGKIKFVNKEWLDFAKNNNSNIKDWLNYDFMSVFKHIRYDSEIDVIERKMICVLSGKTNNISFRFNKIDYILKVSPIKFMGLDCLQIEYFKQT